MKIKKGDKIEVIAGKDKGRTGKVEKVYRKQNKVLILNINIYRKHVKKSEQFPQGGMVEVPRPIDVSKIMLICPSCKSKTRVAFEVRKGKKVRICKKCKAVI